jgi:hypothetical protein
MKELHWESPEHRAFFFENLAKAKNDDAYHQAFFYLVGCSSDTRRNINSLFDFKENCIRPEGLEKGWQTGGTRRLCRLAFNLWNGYTEQGGESMATPYELFDCGYARYMLEGIKLRYPEYCTEIKQQRPLKKSDMVR